MDVSVVSVSRESVNAGGGASPALRKGGADALGAGGLKALGVGLMVMMSFAFVAGVSYGSQDGAPAKGVTGFSKDHCTGADIKKSLLSQGRRRLAEDEATELELSDDTELENTEMENTTITAGDGIPDTPFSPGCMSCIAGLPGDVDASACFPAASKGDCSDKDISHLLGDEPDWVAISDACIGCMSLGDELQACYTFPNPMHGQCAAKDAARLDEAQACGPAEHCEDAACQVPHNGHPSYSVDHCNEILKDAACQACTNQALGDLELPCQMCIQQTETFDDAKQRCLKDPKVGWFSFVFYYSVDLWRVIWGVHAIIR